MKVLFALAALLALAASQCTLEGNTFTAADGRSLTFGKAVGEWVPGLVAIEDGTLSFSTWTQATATRWQVKDFASTADWFCDQEGQYNLEFFNGCTELHFTVLHDICVDRISLLKEVFTHVQTGDDCTSVGSQIESHLSVAKDYPRLSGDAATVTFGLNGYAVVSVADRAFIAQRWRIESGSNGETVSIVDLASHPEGYACSKVQVGVYTAKFNDDCASRLCFSEDACPMRAQLLHDVGLNNFEGDMCTRDLAPDAMGAHCSTGKQWLRHPLDCIAQEVPGGCMFCKGVAMGETTKWCMDRQGAGCNEIFDSVARQAYCNVEFECPAAAVSAPFAIFICALLALFLR